MVSLVLNYSQMRFILCILIVSIGFSCNFKSPKEQIIGAWKVDSTYTYYNGFDFTDKQQDQDWAMLLYEENGTVKEVKFSTFREHDYEFIGKDSLIFRNDQGMISSTFKVLELDDKHLKLYKSKLPIFGGAKQERYEIRYFSRTTRPSNIDAYQPLSPEH